MRINKPTEQQTDVTDPTDYNNPSLRMRAARVNNYLSSRMCKPFFSYTRHWSDHICSMQVQFGAHTQSNTRLLLLRMNWNADYERLLCVLNLPSLSQKRKYLDLCALLKIFHKDFMQLSVWYSKLCQTWQDKKRKRRQ